MLVNCACSHLTRVDNSQGLEDNQTLMDQALKEVDYLTVTLLTKEFSSENLESIFKVCNECLCIGYTPSQRCVTYLYVYYDQTSQPKNHRRVRWENFWSEICNLGVRFAGGAQYSQNCNYCM